MTARREQMEQTAEIASPTPLVVSPASAFPIVGIGASAGGLAAFEEFFSGMPVDTEIGMAFILVQHLAPDHKSMLAELVKRSTRMDVFEGEEGMAVRPNCAYIIPPNRDMAFANGALQLLQPAAPRGRRLPIDFLFRSLAEDQHGRAICIVLSGTGTDGTEGLRLIKGEGGMAMAQSPESTEYGAMPRSAIGTGLVDYTLPPAAMPSKLLEYVRAFDASRHAPPQANAEDALQQILRLLRAQTTHDFSQYKANTINRRIEHRMAIHQVVALEGYLQYLQDSPTEIDALFHDLLIGVTQFFRDPEVFERLRPHLDALIASKPTDSMFRIWTPGCSSGEEAYSLTILLREQLEATRQALKLQVFATDLDSRAIDTARSGRYPKSIAADVSAERLAQFFCSEDGAYRIQKSIREVVVFSEHDVILDPPFAKLDLISCRNVLIYMGQELQSKLIPLFHYALKPGGLLLLGTSESVCDFTNLFEVLDRKTKLYQRKEIAVGTTYPSMINVVPRLTGVSASERPARRVKRDGAPLPLRELTEQALLRYVPVGALVDERGELLYLHGHTGKYLEPAPGEAKLNIVKMAREGLRQDLMIALHRAAANRETVRYAGVRVETGGDVATINLTVEPVAVEADGVRLFLVVFEEALEQSAPDVGVGPTTGAAVDQRVAQLERQLRTKDEYLKFAQQRMQTANEELTSANEELQSMNEELQSTNEELETSKEELQSVNEEVATVNAELQTNVADLARANNDMNNLLSGTGVGTIFVDSRLRIQRFTPAVTQVVNLILGDVGRPLAHVVSNLVGYSDLVVDVQQVLESLKSKEIEVRTHAGDWYLLRILPYRTLENVVEGVVVTFTQVTELRKAQAALRDADELRRMAVVMRDANDAITVQDMDGQILAWNGGAARMYGFSELEALKMNIRTLIPSEERDEASSVVRRLSQAEVLNPFRTQRVTKSGERIEISLTATALVNELGQVYALATTEREAKGAAHA